VPSDFSPLDVSSPETGFFDSKPLRYRPPVRAGLNDPKYQLPLTTDRVENPNFIVAIKQDPSQHAKSSGNGPVCQQNIFKNIQ
jgi:hypothetical protein